MITRKRLLALIMEVAHNPSLLDRDDWSINEILDEMSWKSMNSAPKDKDILVYDIPENKSLGEYCLVVHWDEDSWEWTITGSRSDYEGDYPCAINPVAWMDTPKYEI